MKEPLITFVGLLQKVLVVDSSKLSDFKKCGVRRRPYDPEEKLPSPSTARFDKKIPRCAQLKLMAHVINFHIKTPNVLVIEENDGELIIHYRKGKKEKAAELLGDVLKIWTPIEKWTLYVKGSSLYLQCEGAEYLPLLLAVSTQTPQGLLAEKHKLVFKTEDSTTLCRRLVEPTQLHYPDVAAILTVTQARIDYKDSFLKNMQKRLNNLLNKMPAELKPKIKIIHNLIMHFLKTAPSEQAADEQITALIQKDEILKDLLKENDYLRVINQFRKLLKIKANLLNQLADDPKVALEVNMEHLDPIMPTFNSLSEKLFSGKPFSHLTLKTIAPEIDALFDFYSTQNRTATAELSTLLIVKVLQKYNEMLHELQITAGVVFEQPDPDIERLLRLSYQIATNMVSLVKEALKEDARSCQLAALSTLIKYFCDIKSWDALNNIMIAYTRVLESVSPVTINGHDKDTILLSLKTDFAIRQGKHAQAFESYKKLTERFFGLLKKSLSCKNLYDVACLGESLIQAYAQTDDYVDVLYFSQGILKRMQSLLLNPDMTIDQEEEAEVIVRSFGEHCEKLQGKYDVLRILETPAPRVKPPKPVAIVEETVAVPQEPLSPTLQFFPPHPKQAMTFRKIPKSKKGSSDAENNTPPQAPKEKKYLYVDFGDGYIYDERLGTDQTIIALENGHHGFGTYFGFIDGEYEKSRAQLEKGKIAGPRGQKGMKMIKTNNGKTTLYEMKIMEEESLAGEEFKKTEDGHKLIRFYEPKTHPEMKRMLNNN